jgi:hypothetical protein
MQVTLEKKSHQEKQLDYIEGKLKELLHQIEYRCSSYRAEDVRALREAYSALNKVTLLTDKELDELHSSK